jgi:hypothetical protein
MIMANDEKKPELRPSDFGMPDDDDYAWAIVRLVEKGVIKDRGKRRNGQIVWVSAETVH